MRMLRLSGLILLMLLMAACGGDDEGGEVPTLIPTFDGQEAATDEVQAPSADVTATSTPRVVVPTLPPSWTPEPTATPTVPVTFTPSLTRTPRTSATVTPVAPTPIPPEVVDCSNFGPDMSLSTTTYQLNAQPGPTIAWLPIPDIRYYRIRLFDQVGNEAMPDMPIVEDASTYTIDPITFSSPGRYAWEVQPLDDNLIQVCPGRGEGLTVTD
jgi:hypothetical protein